MNVLPVSSFKADECKCYSSIRDNTYNYVLECYITKNGRRSLYRFESSKILDLKKCKVLSGTISVDKKKI